MDLTEAPAAKTAISCIPSLFSKNSLEGSLHNDEDPGAPSMSGQKELKEVTNNEEPREFSHKELAKVTNNFEKMIGEGAYGAVYLGQLEDKRTVAVKMMSSNSKEAVEQFDHEVALLSRVRHEKLTMLYGFTKPSTRPDERLALVYEFVPNGTVTDHLYDETIPFKWPLRIQTATETAEVLCYLNSMMPSIIHRDVKPDNILLDYDFHVKLTDFGLCRVLSSGNKAVSTGIQSTIGYQDPDYTKSLLITNKADVYSFGVLLIELITRQKAVDVHRFIDGVQCVFLDKIAQNKIMKLLDPEIGYDSNRDVRRIIDPVAKLAFRCIEPARGSRPPMVEVYRVLEKISSKMERLINVKEVIKEMQIASRRKRQEHEVVVSPRISMSVNTSGIHIYTYEELMEATNFFDPSRKLGEGCYGSVYLGKVQDEWTVAVKVLSEYSQEVRKQFSTEVSILSRNRHPNVIALYGCTDIHKEKMLVLVYEYMPNGNLYEHLHSSRHHGSSLPWVLRLQMATQMAEALACLHSAEPPVIHRDVKTWNMLLDHVFHVRVSGFSVAGHFSPDNGIMGSRGYLDPEYNIKGHLTDKSDVYSFGVVLMELISGQKPIDVDRFGETDDLYLHRMALKMIKNNKLEELVDQSLGYDSDSNVKRMVDGVVELSLRCLQPLGTYRPPMADVLIALKGIKDGLEEDRPPMADVLKALKGFEDDAEKTSFFSCLYQPKCLS